jgi:polygalacturonase
VHLESNVNLYLAEGAVLKFSKDPRAYLPVVMTRWEGTECMGYSAFIYANRKQNVAVTGKGTLDGQADNQTWWPWKGRTEFGWKKGDPNQLKARDALVEMGETDVPVEKRMFGEGSLLRPQFIQTYRCRNVLVEGVTMVNSPMWEIHPLLSTNVTVRGVKVSSHGPNNDGCDPESSTDVLIDGCTFDTGDDCIAIKSGRNRDGRRVAAPCENIIIRDCLMKDGHGAVTIGSEMSGGVRNVYAYDCRMESPNQDRILRIKTNSVRGGFVENVFVENMTATEVADAIVHIDFFYEEGDKGKFDPVVRNIDVRNFKCSKAKYAFYLRGFERARIRDVRVTDCVFENVAMADVMENTAGVVMEQVRVNGKEVGR